MEHDQMLDETKSLIAHMRKREINSNDMVAILKTATATVQNSLDAELNLQLIAQALRGK